MSTISSISHRPLLVQQVFRVKTYDIDFAGHVSNIVYIRWLEDLRLAMLEAHLPLADQMEQGIVPMLVETAIQYRRQIGLFREVSGSMWVDSISAVRVKIQAEFTVDEGVCAEARQSGAFVDVNTGRPLRVPRAFVERYSESPSDY